MSTNLFALSKVSYGLLQPTWNLCTIRNGTLPSKHFTSFSYRSVTTYWLGRLKPFYFFLPENCHYKNTSLMPMCSIQAVHLYEAALSCHIRPTWVFWKKKKKGQNSITAFLPWPGKNHKTQDIWTSGISLPMLLQKSSVDKMTIEKLDTNKMWGIKKW
jgi:hypothetical protein